MSFDLKTHIRDKNGKTKRVQPYKLIIRNGEQVFIRDGVSYYPNGVPIQEAAKPVAAAKEAVQQVTPAKEAELQVTKEAKYVGKDTSK